MAEVLSVGYTSSIDSSNINSFSNKSFNKFKELISYLFIKGNNESDTNHPTIILLDTSVPETGSKLDLLSHEDKMLLLKYFFNHLNIMIIRSVSINDDKIVEELNNAINKINKLIHNRISRMEIWTGTGSTSINDFYVKEKDISFEISDIISTMSFVLSHNLNKSSVTINHIIHLKDMILEEIDFKALLSNNSPEHLSKLCHLVGHWSFPAHELSNDDLIYCVYLIIRYALRQVKTDELQIPSSNELLGLVFMVRDSYNRGNPFHNFRHAVDVLQACFHFLIRLNCLPVFKQLEINPKADETLYLLGKKNTDESTELIPLARTKAPSHLNPLETLALLIAALGHDVGHPGVTNAFLIKYSSPTSLIYNERSVLESYHTSIFINKVLTINWPSLLNLIVDEESHLSLKNLVTSCILATDMAEHFEYIEKLKIFKYNKSSEKNRVKLISSLLIKCADISNVTRPLRVSSQWAMVLSREFEEILILEKKLNNQLDSKLDLNFHYTKLPNSLNEILNLNPNLHKGQIFFINTFAENLFNNIADLLPELRYTCEIIQENKHFWLSRS